MSGQGLSLRLVGRPHGPRRRPWQTGGPLMLYRDEVVAVVPRPQGTKPGLSAHHLPAEVGLAEDNLHLNCDHASWRLAAPGVTAAHGTGPQLRQGTERAHALNVGVGAVAKEARQGLFHHTAQVLMALGG